MDLSKRNTLKADTGAVLTLKDPASFEALEGVTITLLGSDSKKYRQLQQAKQQTNIDRQLRGKKARLRADEMERETIEDLAECTLTWANVSLDESVMECTHENAVKVYTELLWVREQALEFLAERANFI